MNGSAPPATCRLPPAALPPAACRLPRCVRVADPAAGTGGPGGIRGRDGVRRAQRVLGTGGSWLLDTVDGGLETAGRSGTPAVLAAVWAAAVLKAVAALIPVLYGRLSAGRLRADRPAVRRLRLLRILMWLEAASLTLYGGVLTTVGLLARGGVIASGADADERALAWHAYLRDPWFPGWGLPVLVVLVTTRPAVSGVT